MTEWRGFVEESKSYMNHPDYWKEWKFKLYDDDDSTFWTEKDKFYAVLNFWRKFPRAWVRFYWQVFRDWVKETGLKERIVQGKSVHVYTKRFGREVEVVMKDEYKSDKS